MLRHSIQKHSASSWLLMASIDTAYLLLMSHVWSTPPHVMEATASAIKNEFQFQILVFLFISSIALCHITEDLLKKPSAFQLQWISAYYKLPYEGIRLLMFSGSTSVIFATFPLCSHCGITWKTRPCCSLKRTLSKAPSNTEDGLLGQHLADVIFVCTSATFPTWQAVGSTLQGQTRCRPAAIPAGKPWACRPCPGACCCAGVRTALPGRAGPEASRGWQLPHQKHSHRISRAGSDPQGSPSPTPGSTEHYPKFKPQCLRAASRQPRSSSTLAPVPGPNHPLGEEWDPSPQHLSCLPPPLKNQLLSLFSDKAYLT